MAPGDWNVLFMTLPPARPEWTAVAVEGVEVKAGEVAKADFRATSGRLLRGQVFNPATKAPLAGPSKSATMGLPKTHGLPLPASSSTRMSEGRFKFHVPPGETYVYVATGLAGQPSRTLVVEPDRDPAPIVFKDLL